MLSSHLCVSLIIRSHACSQSVIEVFTYNIRYYLPLESTINRYLTMALHLHEQSSSTIGPKDCRDAHRTLAGWKNLSKTELRAKAQMYGVEQIGKKETTALRLYSFFDNAATDNESSASEADPVAGPSSTGEQEVLQPNQPQASTLGSSMVTFSLEDLKN